MNDLWFNMLLTEPGNRHHETAIAMIDQECCDQSMTLTQVHALLARPNFRAILAVQPLNETTSRPVGYTIFEIVRGQEPRVVIASLVVRPNYRRKGVGSALLKATGELMGDTFPKLDVFCLLSNQVGLAFLKKFNNSIAGGALGSFKMTDKQQDIVRFRLSVATPKIAVPV